MRAVSGAMAAALVLSGCAGKVNKATTAPAVPVSPLAQPADVSYGTILAERPVTVEAADSLGPAVAGPATGGTAGSASGGDVRSSILAAIGDAGPGVQASGGVEAGVPTDNVIEFIILVDDGRTISVVQSNGFKLGPGARVMIIHGAETRLAPPAHG